MGFAALDSEILGYLKAGNTLTPASAMSLFHTTAMHSCAARLRKAGHNIACRMVGGYGEYSYVAPQEVAESERTGPKVSLPAAIAAPDEQLITVYPKNGKPYQYTASGFASKPV